MRSLRLAAATCSAFLASLAVTAASGLATADSSSGGGSSGWAFAAVLLCIGGVWLVGLLFWIWLLTYIYRDAESRGMSGVLWVILILFAGLLGMIIYLIAREPERPPQPRYYPPARDRIRYCVMCKKNIPYDSWVCPYCGHDYRKK